MSDDNGQAQAAETITIVGADEVEQLAGFAPERPPQFDKAGRVVRLLITPKDFLPPGVEAIRMIGAEQRGTRITLGTLAGEVTGVELHRNDWNGKTLESHWLKGYFEAVVASTGETFAAPCVALPKSYATKIAIAVEEPGFRRAALGVSIGLEASVRGAIAFAWFVRDHLFDAAAARVATTQAFLVNEVLGGGVALKQLPGNFDDAGRLIANR